MLELWWTNGGLAAYRGGMRVEVSGGERRGEAAVVRVGGDGVQEGVGGGVELRRGASHLLVIWEVWSRVGWGLIA